MIYYTECDSPIGKLLLHSDGTALTGLYMDEPRDVPGRETWVEDATAGPLPATLRQLLEYFEGSRRDFGLPLCAQGTAFQQRVWRSLLKIGFGETWSYGELAQRIDNPGAAQCLW